ncbi:MAG: hypothetical protein IKW08_04595 [Roseburia sp.]|nr:hypothetical protein [Roseburia sp.]
MNLKEYTEKYLHYCHDQKRLDNKTLKAYTIEAKTKSSFTSTVSTAYWLIITAVFLSMTLSTNEWSQTIYIWPVAGILFPAVLALVKYFDKN